MTPPQSSVSLTLIKTVTEINKIKQEKKTKRENERGTQTNNQILVLVWKEDFSLKNYTRRS